MTVIDNRKVIIFRKRLLAFSETFIAAQGINLPHMQAAFCGFETDASGFHLLDGQAVELLEARSVNMSVSKFMLRSGLLQHHPWLTALAALDPLLIHAHFLGDGIDAMRLSNRLDLPLMTTLHGHDITKQKMSARQRNKMHQLFERCACVIAVSDFIAEKALGQGCPENKLVKHSIGIDLSAFTDNKEESEHPSLLFVGRLVEKKGCTFLLKALRRLQTKFPQMTLTIVGDGNLRQALQQEAADYHLQVEFVGIESSDQIRRRLATSWLFTAPSITAENGDCEGLGMVFLEAQALQTPVVSFQSGGVVEAVAHAESGLLCVEKDVNQLAENIEYLLENPAARQQMGRNGRRRIETLFDLKKQCATLEQLYLKIS